MDYTDVGHAAALSGRIQDAQTLLASYTGYQGRPCTQVVGELVDEINALGYFDATVGGHEKNIILKLERGSAYPSDQFLNELAEADRLLVETDCPYMAPVPMRGKRNEPAFVAYTAQKVAELRGMDAEEFALAAYENGKRLFGI